MAHTHSHHSHNDHDHHDHSHHGHAHHHHGTGNIKVAFFLNLGFAIIEIVGGSMTNSVAILSDALHDLGDSVSLGLAWHFQKLSAKKRDHQFSYGYKRFAVLGAFINSLILVVGSIFILQEAIPRLFHPEQTNAKGMLALAVLGVIVNGAAVFRLKKGTTLNERAVALHLMEDVLGWVAVLIASVIMLFADVPFLDPLLSLLITGYVLFNVYKNLRASFQIFLQSIPQSIDVKKVERRILSIPQIISLHDIHVWSLDGEYNVLTVHLVVNRSVTLPEIGEIKKKVKLLLNDLHIQHVTTEVELEGEICELEDC